MVGGKTNLLGRSAEVLRLVLDDASLLDELYECMFDEDAWVRMRAADTIEKVCREHPEWIEKYVNRFIDDFSSNTQASIQWHLAQIYRQVALTDIQKRQIILWLENLLATTEIDWIVAANAMDTLAQFTSDGAYPRNKLMPLLDIQSHHRSKSVVKRAARMRSGLK